MEDADICIRIGKLDWELYRNPKAIVKHKNPTTLRDLVKQWKGYMIHMPYLYRKHNTRAIEIFAFDQESARIKCVFFKPFFMPILIVLNTTLKAHLSFVCFIVFSLTNLWVLASFFLVMSLFYFYKYFIHLVVYFYINMEKAGYFKNHKKMKSFKILIQFICISYVENLTIVFFGFWGGCRNRMLFIYGDPAH